nr:secretory phospholipase A2 receptor-like [Danio rerio]|eukprot:XP_017206500.1 secretory phospholipase A2 receptor-like [Danio rerio]
MDESLFVLLLLSGLSCSSSAVYLQYNYMNQPMSWSDAQSYCRERFTDLATVDTVDDVNRLINTVDAGYSGSVWIGLKREISNHWVWSNGEDTIAKYSDWAPGEPASGNDCALFNDIWLTTKCSNLYGALCLDEFNGYRMTLIKMNWTAAQSYCRKQFTDLAPIYSKKNKSTLHTLANYLMPLWIGLYRDSWKWSDKWNGSFRYWAAGQPFQSAGSVDCVGMTTTDSGKWAPYSCDLQQPFICYGDDKFIRKQTVRLKLSCNGNCALNNPSLQTVVLNQITERLKGMGLQSDSKISWIKSKEEEVSAQKSNRTENSQECGNIP